jgi:hypothetical protein
VAPTVGHPSPRRGTLLVPNLTMVVNVDAFLVQFATLRRNSIRYSEMAVHGAVAGRVIARAVPATSTFDSLRD